MNDWQSPFSKDELEWQYNSDDFYSQYMSSAQMLPNGNIFICEGNTGRFLEINEAKEIVWEYINPVNSNGNPAFQGGTVRFNQTFRATKYLINYPAFEYKNMEGTIPVELNPWKNDCFIPEIIEALKLEIRGNIIQEELIIESNSIENINFQLINIAGRILEERVLEKGENIYHLDYSKGIYFISFFENENLETKKIIIY